MQNYLQALRAALSIPVPIHTSAS